MPVDYNEVSGDLLPPKKLTKGANQLELEGLADTVWLSGAGPKPCHVMVIASSPYADEVRVGAPFSSRSILPLGPWMAEAGLDPTQAYLTYAVKYPIAKKRKIGKRDLRRCRQSLLHEIEQVNPRVIICLGATPFTAVTENGKLHFKYTDYLGTPVSVPHLPGICIIPTWMPVYVSMNPDLVDVHLQHLRIAAKAAAGESVAVNEVEEFEVIKTSEHLWEFLGRLLPQGEPRVVAMDTETAGGKWVKKTSYVRTIQLTWDKLTGVIQCFPPGTEDELCDTRYTYPDCIHPTVAVSLIRHRFELVEVSSMVGHNFRYDALWFLKYGWNCAKYFSYDTMLVAHLIKNLGLHNLEAIAARYSQMGRYDQALNGWKQANPKACIMDVHGYGCVPSEILYPYGAGDTQATWKVMMAQAEFLRRDPELSKRILSPRGTEGQYPSLCATVLEADKVLLEVEFNGMPIDLELLEDLRERYNTRGDELRTLLSEEAHKTLGESREVLAGKLEELASSWVGMPGFDPGVTALLTAAGRLRKATPLRESIEAQLVKALPSIPEPGPTEVEPLLRSLRVGPDKDFNPESPKQVAAVLFNPAGGSPPGLGLVPVMSTDKTPWQAVVARGEEKTATPHTGNESLEIISEGSPFVEAMIKYRTVAVICKNFVRRDDTGGIPGNLHEGRLYPHFALTSETGRLKSRNPNVQNLPNAAEAGLLKAFGEGNIPASLRSLFIPPAGWVLVEGDYAQAELFTLANLSGDSVMIDVLTSPGRDLHDKTAINAFHLTVLWEDGSPVDLEAEYALASQDLGSFESRKSAWTFMSPKGQLMNAQQMKKSVRISAKAINFGIMYGRGAEAIALQVKSETGLAVSTEEMQAGIDGWRATYPTAAAYLADTGTFAANHGYVENPWGRRRYFENKTKEWEIASIKREAANFPIQSTVADTVLLAMGRLVKIRRDRNLTFLVYNQIHDSLLIAVPPDALEPSKAALEEALSGVDIPIPQRPTTAHNEQQNKSFTLSVDLEVLGNRWKEIK